MATAQESSSTRAMFLLRANPTFEEELREEMRALPAWVVDLLLRMLQTLPLDRPTAEECLAVFEEHLGAHPPSADGSCLQREFSASLTYPLGEVHHNHFHDDVGGGTTVE
jgi:hypothetical protein